jgi:hypothetical protein
MKDFKGDFGRFKKHRAKTITGLDLIIKDLKAENKELQERLKICAKNVGVLQKKLEKVGIDIEVKIGLYEKDLKARKYHKYIVMLLKQIRNLV